MMIDNTARQQAINPRQSFIVQAPAGSGKTELLIQRYLSLLAVVDKAPEEVLAITFTNKAANEMRERIRQALLLAQQPEPQAAYKKLTWQLAKQALARSEQLNWDLLNKPARMRIQTIDSFCMRLVQQMPLLSRLGMIPDTAKDLEANALYETAAENLLLSPAEDATTQDAIQQLLLHLDNNLLQVRNLLVNMLKNRDQWLPLLNRMRNENDLRSYLENNLQILVKQNLQHAYDYFPAELRHEAAELLNYAGAVRELPAGHSQAFPTADVQQLPNWQALIELLLTQDDTWRRQVTKRDGFPAKGDGKTSEEKHYFQAQKDRCLHVIGRLSSLEDLREALSAVRQSPQPQYSEQQWQILQALLHLLPIAAAELKIIFQRQNKVDFIEVTQAAIQALGDADSPSDLALRLDHQIKHILVDEFQDTSTSQYHLLELLTAGWQSDDGRTLFLVGDPMQSIYRFRGAEVGLFLRAQQYGIGSIALTSLILQTNFRSQADIIDWINNTFPQVFPTHEDIANNKVKFSPSVAAHPTINEPVQVHTHATKSAAYTATIVNLIQQAQRKDPSGSIAVLVRSRAHLAEIIPALQQKNITYQAIEIEHLAANMLIQDLISLTCALLHLGDRLAWLSVLRSPCCGLTLNDLYTVAQQADTQTIWQRLNTDSVLQRLSANGRQRVLQVCNVLQQSLLQRQRLNIRDWIEQTWLALRGPATATSNYDLANAKTFFDLLSKLEASDILINRASLSNYLNILYAAPTLNASANVQIMTVHKAKGLEFDTVILPSLEKKTQHDMEQLLIWFEQPREHQGSDLLIAPIKPKHQQEDPIYQYLKNQQSRISDYENSRLLYVAATRAKKRLYLLANIETDKDGDLKKPTEKTWLGKLWDSCHKEFIASEVAAPNLETIKIAEPRYLRRLSDSYFI